MNINALIVVKAAIGLSFVAPHLKAQSYYMLEEFGSEPDFSYTVDYSGNASFTANGGRLYRYGMTFHFTNETDGTLEDVRFVLTGVQAAYSRNDNTHHTTTLFWDPASGLFVGDNPLLTSPYDGNPDDHTANFRLFDGSYFSTTDLPLSDTGIPSDFLRLSDTEIPPTWGLDVTDYANPSLNAEITYPYLVLGNIAPGQTVSMPSFYMRIEQPQGFTNDGWYVFGRFIAATPVPEPSGILLMSLAGVGAFLRRRRQA